MRHTLPLVVSVFFAATMTAAIAEPPSDSPDKAPKPRSVCLNAGDIDHLSYPDDQTILFHMKGGKVRIWKNDLPRACQGLKFESAVAYEIRGGTICGNMQTFYVLNRWTPCNLGPFTPYTPPPKDPAK